MIPGWLRLSNNNIVQLLHHLDVGNSDQDAKGAKSAPAGALNVLFMDTPYRELVKSFQYLDTDKLIPYEKLTPETAMYWRVLAEFFAEQNGPGAEEYLEMILPELSPFCQYVRRYVLELEKVDEDGNWEFVAKELISMTTIYDLGDEVGRQNLCRLVKDLLTSSKTPVTFIPTLVTVFTMAEKNTQSRIDQVAEIISELKDPMVADTVPSDRSSPDYYSAPETPLQPPAQDEEVIRAKQLQIAKLRVEMNLLRDQLDEAVTGQNFLIAQQIKAQMDQLEEDQAMLEDQLSAAKAIGAAPPQSATTAEATPAATAAQLDLSESTPVFDNPAVTLKCLRLLVATLQDPSITQLNSTLHTLLEEFVTVSVQSELPSIRKEAITALTCCCLRSIENARQHMLLLLQAAHIDVHEVRIAAIIGVVVGQAPSPRAAHSVSVVGSMAYVFGGRHLDTRLNDLHSLDLVTLKWSLLVANTDALDVPVGRSWQTMTPIHTGMEEGGLIMYGGFDNNLTALGDCWRMDLSQEPSTWVRCPHLELGPRLWHAAVGLDTSQEMIVGGLTNNILAPSYVAKHHAEKVLFLRVAPPSLLKLCLEFITKHRDLFNKEAEELPLSLKRIVKIRCSSGA